MADVEDTFTEASTNTDLDAHTPTGADAGTGWTEIEQTGAHRLQAKQSTDTCSASNGEPNDRWMGTIQPDPTGAEYDIQVTLTSVETLAVRPVFFLARLADSDNYYSAGAYEADEAADVQIFIKTTSGGVVNLDSQDTGWADGDVMKFEVRDATKKLYKNGSEVASTTNDDITAAGQIGLGIGNAWVATDNIGSNWELDDFSYTEAAGGGGRTTYNTDPRPLGVNAGMSFRMSKRHI